MYPLLLKCASSWCGWSASRAFKWVAKPCAFEICTSCHCQSAIATVSCQTQWQSWHRFDCMRNLGHGRAACSLMWEAPDVGISFVKFIWLHYTCVGLSSIRCQIGWYWLDNLANSSKQREGELIGHHVRQKRFKTHLDSSGKHLWCWKGGVSRWQAYWISSQQEESFTPEQQSGLCCD